MIPSLVAGELKDSIVEYLATTFALSDDEAYEALTAFLVDEDDGIFRGPYLRVRLPFVDAPEDADFGVVWTPEGFQPYVHQLVAWRRLAGRSRIPQPTLVTTGTGSGKSEAFLVPAIDHAIWARETGQRGIKALLLYPMNALVADQERRIAAMLTDPAAQAAGVRGGVWIGDDGSIQPRRDMDGSHLISDPAALQDDPPDILLTNYKMLDRLLLNPSRQRLWAANTRPGDDDGGWEQPLTYLVLDEIHTYDGAQGTDIAMLLRRLGHRLGTANRTSPLNNVGCVGTSATLGSSPTAAADVCSFASRVFGTRFDVAAIIGEDRMTVADVCGDIDFSLPVPPPAELVALDPSDLDGLAQAFTRTGFDNPQDVGDRLVRHRLTASLLRNVADQPRRWPDAVAAIAQQAPEWGAVLADDPELVGAALERFVALVSQARGRTRTGETRPLFSVEVQVWIREVTRLKRAIAPRPSFRWADSPHTDHAAIDLPSVYCTSCGRSGWLGVANRAGGQGGLAIERLVHDEITDPYQVAVRDRERTRTILRANPDEPDILWLDVDAGQVHSTESEQQTRIAVLIGGMTGESRTEEDRDDAAKRQQCPSCGARDAIRFLGSRVTTLASVGITQMFGSDHVADDERKLLAFTDSVQDASHRAAFFSGRAHRFNLRATLSAALQAKGRVPLQRVAEVVLSRAENSDKPTDDLFSLVPPDLLWEGWLAAAWETPQTPDGDKAQAGIAERLAFDAVLEAGLRSRLGRTLETTGTAIADVLVADDEWSNITGFATEAIQASTGQLLTDPDRVRTWIAGVLERLRGRGGIYHHFLDRYVAEHGQRWWIWGGGDPLAPKFPQGISAPAFFASTPSNNLDPISGSQSWPQLWARKVLDIDGAGADQALRDLLHILTEAGILENRSTTKGQAWGLPASRIEFVDNARVDGQYPNTELRCDLCAHRHYTTPEHFATWTGRPCLRLRCTGEYEPAPVRPTNYYRQLYRSGEIRRVVAAEHTGMLTRERRERIETGFKNGGRPDAPNVLAATPTLEMGIDIGDLSAVMLTAVPPTQTNYVQRIGRAGRTTGNAFVTMFAEGDPRSLYFLHDPELMIAGEIIAPSCYLDAIEILRRQYTAFLVDQAALGAVGDIPQAGEMPRTIGQAATTGMHAGGWLSEILDAGRNPEMIARFVGLFGNHLAPSAAARLASWATTDMRSHVERVVQRWQSHVNALANQRDRLREREKPLAALEHPTPEDIESLGRIVAELRYVAGRITGARNQDTLGALEALGLLPNYTLFDDTVNLQVSLWRPNEAHDASDEQSRRFISDASDYARPASTAIRELAPGNYFYVDAHRVRIDAVDNGTEHEPAHALWRFCPTCAWASTDPAPVNACPRCGTDGVKDQGSLLTVLPMRVVSSTERETSARVSDDSEDRDREWHEVVTTVDIDPADITSAHLHTKTVFGVESVRAAKIRYLNLGLHASRGGLTRQIRINGHEAPASLFRVCRHCGGVFGIRGDPRDDDDPNHHRSWCKVRSGARNQQWDHLALIHELVTEAVRILLPVAEFEAEERILSFKAALLLGLRDSFGGDPSHLRVLDTDFPAPGSDADVRNRFVVVHDTVPGGTGYLPRLADPERLRLILDRAVELITTCECQTRGQPGCHRCLYTAVNRHEIPLVSRRVSLETLDEILSDWQMSPAAEGTVTGVNLSAVRQSELERMFKTLLHRWADDGPARVNSRPDPAQANCTRFDVRFHGGPHWEIREQVNLVSHSTRPDFYATRIDGPVTAPVAIYLDGWEHHGADQDQVDHDSTRRASVRAAATSVWALTWHDVKAALTAASQGSTVPASLPLSNSIRHRARQGAEQAHGSFHGAFEALSAGAFQQLMLRLEHPEPDAWQALAMTTALAAGQAGSKVPVTAVDDAMTLAAQHEAVIPAPHETGIAAMAWTTSNGQTAATILERDGALPRVVLTLDTSSEPDKGRWTDWLHMANLLQHLGRNAVLSTTRSYVPEAMAVPTIESALDAEVMALDLLDEVFDQAVIPLAEAAMEEGWTELVVGHSAQDEDDTPIEVAWPSSKVGILPAGVDRPGTLLDWDLRTPDAWTVQELLIALAQGES